MPNGYMGKWLCTALLCGLASVAFAQIEKLIYLTEENPPYNYRERGILSGPSVELLLAITQKLGQPIDRSTIRLLPWARAYRELQQGPNRVLFVTTKTQERAQQFQWAGPINVDYVALIAHRSKKLRITEGSQLQHLRIGLVRDDVVEEFLDKFNIDQKLVIRANTSTGLARMLVADRIDLWPMDPRGADSILKKLGANLGEFEIVANLHAAPLYFAFSQDVDSGIVMQFQMAIDELRHSQPELFPDASSAFGRSDILPLQ